MHFVGTNILVYCFDESDPAKRDRALLVMSHLWQSRHGRLSHQVLQEFYTTVTRKLKPALPKSMARSEISDLLGWDPIPPSATIFKQAWQIEDRHGFSWWDSLIVAAAHAQNCSTLLTEDLQNGLEIGGLRIVNPFSPDFSLDALSVKNTA